MSKTIIFSRITGVLFVLSFLIHLLTVHKIHTT
jgi:hypothetical protein